MAVLPNDIADSALARLFTGEAMADRVSWFSLPGGQVLCEAGEQADELYFLRTGRLAAVRHDEGQEPQFLGVIRPGEPAGEMALIAGTRHSANVVALRDSEILALPREDFFEAAEHDPTLMIELAQLMMLRSRQTDGRTTAGDAERLRLHRLQRRRRHPRVRRARRPRDRGRSAIRSPPPAQESLSAPTEWFSNVEQAHDFVLYAADYGQVAWKQLVGRQVDRLFRVGRGDAPAADAGGSVRRPQPAGQLPGRPHPGPAGRR